MCSNSVWDAEVARKENAGHIQSTEWRGNDAN